MLGVWEGHLACTSSLLPALHHLSPLEMKISTLWKQSQPPTTTPNPIPTSHAGTSECLINALQFKENGWASLSFVSPGTWYFVGLVIFEDLLPKFTGTQTKLQIPARFRELMGWKKSKATLTLAVCGLWAGELAGATRGLMSHSSHPQFPCLLTSPY